MYQVEGYDFEDRELAEKAATEAEGIKYIKERTRMDDPDMVLKLYNQMLQEQMFETPVGLGFLYELQEYLHTIPYIKNEDISPIPVKATLSAKEEKEKRKSAKRDKTKGKEESKTQAESGTSPNENAKKARRSGKMNSRKQETLNPIARKYKGMFHVSLFFTAVFAAIIVGMFAITYLSGNSVTILNYENAIIDKYESWEEELNEREQELKKKAIALQVQDSEENTQDGTESEDDKK